MNKTEPTKDKTPVVGTKEKEIRLLADYLSIPQLLQTVVKVF